MKSFEWIESVPMLTMKGIMIATKVKLTGELSLKCTRIDLAGRGIITTDETVWIDGDGEFFWPGSEKSLDK